MRWMTEVELADWWRGTMDAGLGKVFRVREPVRPQADNTVGFCLAWGMTPGGDGAETMALDRLRPGNGSGPASVAGGRAGVRGALSRDLDVVTDFGQAMAFIPLGKVVRFAGPRVPAATAARSVPSKAPTGSRAAAAPGTAPEAMAPGAVGLESTEQSRAVAADILSTVVTDLAGAAPDHRICSFEALKRALDHVGHLHIRIDDIARLAGIRAPVWCTPAADALEALWVTGNDLGPLRQVLSRLGIRSSVGDARLLMKDAGIPDAPAGVKSADLVRVLEEALRRAGTAGRPGVILFGVVWDSTVLRRRVGHALYAALDDAGRLVIYDRTGHSARTLAELERLAGAGAKAHSYLGLGGAALRPDAKVLMIPMANVQLKATSNAGPTRRLTPQTQAAAGLFGPVMVPVRLHMGIAGAVPVRKP